MTFAEVVASLGRVAGNTIQASGVQVSVKTNLGPEFKIWDGKAPTAGSAGIARLLGIRAAVIVRDANGKLLFTQGEPPATNLLLTGGLLAGAAFLGFLMVRGFVKR